MEGLGEALKLAPALGPWFGIAVIVGILIRSMHPYIEARRQSAENEVARSAARITALEERLEAHQTQATAERQRLEDKIEAQRQRYEAIIDRERALHDAEASALRHQVRNINQVFVLFLEMIEAMPERAAEFAARARALRAEQVEQEESEKIKLRTARIEATTAAVPDAV